MGAITVRREVVGKMSAAVFALGVVAFLLGFVHPFFFPLAWMSLLGGALVGTVLWARNRRASHPTVSHLVRQPEERNPIQPH